MSLYGLVRFPVTLFKKWWLKVVGFVDVIQQFIDEHGLELKNKEQRE